MERTQNISCYIFIISLVWNSYWSRVIQTFFIHHFSCLCLQSFLLWSSYTNFTDTMTYSQFFENRWESGSKKYMANSTDKKVIPANIYLFEVNNRNNRKRCEICSKLTKNDVIDVILVFLLLTLIIFQTFSYCFYCWLWKSKC